MELGKGIRRDGLFAAECITAIKKQGKPRPKVPPTLL